MVRVIPTSPSNTKCRVLNVRFKSVWRLGLPPASTKDDVRESYTLAVVWFGALGVAVHSLVEFRIGDGGR